MQHGIKQLIKQLVKEVLEEEEAIEEANAMASGNIVGYTAPLGMPTGAMHKRLWSGSKKDRPSKPVKTASPALHKEAKSAEDKGGATHVNKPALSGKEKNVGAMNPPVYDPPIPTHKRTTQAMPGLWRGLEDPYNPVKTGSPELNEEEAALLEQLVYEALAEAGFNKELMKKMGYEYAGKSYRLGSDTFVYKDDPSKAKSKKQVKAAHKEQQKSHTAAGRLHNPGGVGLTLPKKFKG